MLINKIYGSICLFALMVVLMPIASKAQIEDIQVGSTTRQMLVYAPSGLESNSPLLLSLHGMNQDIAYQQNQTKWELVAKENGFVVVYPGGINNSWDIGGTRDIDFILTIIDEMHQRYDIDRDRVYLSGFSMGGMMTYHAATQIADKIAAFAPVSGYLMGGPNTNSSRPIPLIHTHGTTDDVVPFSGVQRCLDAWIERNNCPATPEFIERYPEGKPNTNGSKYTWGPGTDSVEVVLLSLKGSGHWHSNNENAVHTSREIWNFCKKYTLAYGIPKLKIAEINDDDPKQILMSFTLPIKESENFEGFIVKVDDQIVEIDTVVLAGPNHLAINLNDSILNSNEITLSYSSGNVQSTYEKSLSDFNDAIVENLLEGAPPRLIEITVSENGDTLIAKFNKHMLIPDNIEPLILKVEFDSIFDIQITQCSFYDNDSTLLAFSLEEQVFADYKLLLSYSGNNIASVDSGLVNSFTDLLVTNTSKGLPVHLVSGTLETNAIAIALEFSKPMSMNDDQLEQLSFTVNGESISINELFTLDNSIRFILLDNLYYGDSIKVTYTPGNITASNKGELQAFNEFIVENPLSMPTWYPVPGKIEAEDYALQFGTDTEPVSDEGGGLNVGWTDSGDWLVYAIENNTGKTEFEISFRIAAESSGARFDYYINDERLGFLNVPGTGGWQSWQSVIRNITIPAGQNYLKFVTINGGFNINYFEIQEEFVGIKEQTIEKVKIFPNPVSNKIVISTSDLKYEKIEIFDAMGKSVFNKKLSHAPEIQLALSLPDGIYSVKLSEGCKYHYSRIIIRNE